VIPLAAPSCANDLAELSHLTVDRADVDDASEAPLPHACDDRPAGVEAGAQVRLKHLRPLLRGHLVQAAIAGDPSVVHQDLERTNVLLDLRDARGHGVIAAYVELVGRDRGASSKCLCCLVIPAVIAGDAVAGCLQGDADCFPDAAGSPSDQCYSPHRNSAFAGLLLLGSVDTRESMPEHGTWPSSGSRLD